MDKSKSNNFIFITNTYILFNNSFFLKKKINISINLYLIKI